MIVKQNKSKLYVLLGILAFMFLFAVQLPVQAVMDPASMKPVALVGGLPAPSLIANQGQFPAGVRYYLPLEKGAVWVLENSFWFQTVDPPTPDTLPVKGINIHLTFPGANPHPVLEPIDRVEGKFSFFVGDDPAKWKSEMRAWGGVRFQELYPGIDLVFDPGDMPSLTFETSPGSQIEQLALQVEGAETLTLVEDALLLSTGYHDLTLQLPLPHLDSSDYSPIWNRLNTPRINKIGFDTFEVTNPFVLAGVNAKPNLQDLADTFSFSTFLGGSDWDIAYDIAVDEYGAIYLVGRTASLDFPVSPGAFDLSRSQIDVFVAKLNADGSDIEYATYIGGSDTDSGRGISVRDGIAYITGDTRSSDFPGDSQLIGENDVFLVALNRSGSGLVFSKLIGGSDLDFSYDITTADDAIYLTGTTVSSDFPASGYKAEGDAFAIKTDLNGEIEYATLLGGSLEDNGFGIAVRQGEAYLTGSTQSIDFPAPITGYRGKSEAYLAKLDQAGELVFARFLGDVGDENGNALVVDSQGNSYLIGTTNSVGFPVTSGSYGGNREAFLAHFDPNGELQAARYLGGFRDDLGFGISFDPEGKLWVAGQTSSTNFPISSEAAQRVLGGGNDAFLASIDPNELQTILYGSYLGGGGDDRGFSLALDPVGNPILTGLTASDDFPTTDGSLDNILNGLQDTFITKFEFFPFNPPPTPTSPPPTSTQPRPTSTTSPGALTSTQTPLTSTPRVTGFVSPTPTPSSTGEVIRTNGETPTDSGLETPSITQTQVSETGSQLTATAIIPAPTDQGGMQDGETKPPNPTSTSPVSMKSTQVQEHETTSEVDSTTTPFSGPDHGKGPISPWIFIIIGAIVVIGIGAAYWWFKIR